KSDDTHGEVVANATEVAAARADIAAIRTKEWRDRLIRWLSIIDYSSNYNAAGRKREPSTGKWLLGRAEFKTWKQVQNSFLWLHGKRNSTVINHITVECARDDSLATAYFFFDFNSRAKQNTTNLLVSLLAQLCSQVIEIPESLEDLYNRSGGGVPEPSVPQLVEVLKSYSTLTKFRHIFLIIDALDECPKGEQREELLEVIVGIASWPSTNLNILVTSRKDYDIAESLTPLLTIPAIAIQGPQVASDIDLYIETQLASKMNRVINDMKSEIKQALIQKADGMFRWVFCQLEVLKKCPTRPAIRKALKSLPATLDGTYERILSNITDENEKTIARRCLIWLAFARKRVTLGELAEAAVLDQQPFDPEERLLDPSFILELL
ncbi:MAG: hypothetical protein Q9187_009425, partial [Circinaria calcarea]